MKKKFRIGADKSRKTLPPFQKCKAGIEEARATEENRKEKIRNRSQLSTSPGPSKKKPPGRLKKKGSKSRDNLKSK